MSEEDKKESIEERQIVVFNIGKEEFGVNINEVREIIRMEQITKIPNTSSYIKGVINLRGGIIVVMPGLSETEQASWWSPTDRVGCTCFPGRTLQPLCRVGKDCKYIADKEFP